MSHSCLAVTRYLLDYSQKQYGRGLSVMKVLKLVYIAHGWYLGLYGLPLIREKAEAWKYGPVIPELYKAIKHFRDEDVSPDGIRGPKEKDDPDFNENERNIMDQTMDIYSRKPALQLSRITHAPGTPWDVIYNIIGESFEIPNDLIEDHYETLHRQRKKRDANG